MGGRTLILLTRPFRQWRSHAILPMRSLLATAAYIWVRQLVPLFPVTVLAYLPDPAMLFYFLFTIHVSHYLSAGVAKVQLGPRWYSWLLDNPLHFLLANAYAWGWARFVPWSRWLKVIRAVERLRLPSLFACLALELLAPLALLSREAAVVACVSWCGFHLLVFLLSGLLFWDWMGANLILLFGLLSLPQEIQPLLGWPYVLLSLAFILLFPFRNRLWGPIMLGWWESPITQRMHWVVEGRSGKRYEVFNNFMCPHERLYGVVHGVFMAPVPLLSYAMGSVWDADHRDALARAVQVPETLEVVRERFGVQPRHPTWEANHIAYLRRFFLALNRGAQKHVLPRWLLWFKALGGHLYSWGDLPAYRGQEPVSKVEIYFREYAFDGAELRLWHDERIQEIRIEDHEDAGVPAYEPTSRDVERFISGAFWQKA